MSALSFMQESVFADEIASRKGFLQARNPHFKAISILLLLLCVLLTRSAAFLSALYLLCLLLAATSFINPLFFLKRTWFFIPLFCLFIALPAVFDVFTPGEAVISLGSVSITKQGLAGAGIFFMRVLVSVSFAILLSLTTRHSVLLKTLRTYGVPQVFVMTMSMSYRYIFLFIEVIQNTYMAVKSRVGDISSSGRGQRIVAWNIASLWQRSYHLQNQVYAAMLSRGYGGEPAVLGEHRFGAQDIAWALFSLGIFILGLWVNRYLN